MSTDEPISPDPVNEVRMTRGKFLAAGGGALAAGLLAACGGSSSGTTTTHHATASTVAKGGTLNLYTWPNYFSTKNLAAYKRETGTAMNISTYDSNDILFAKLNSAAGVGFDIVVPTSGWIQTMAHHGLLAKLDHSRIPFNHVNPALLNKVFDPGNVYSVPKDYGVLGVVYDPVAVGGTIKTWQDFLDAGDKPGVKGKVQLSDAGWEVVAIPLWAADDDYNTQDTAKINHYGAIMKDWAKNVKEFSGFDITGPAHGTIAMSQTDQSVGRQCLLQNKKLKWVVPGPTSELWVDNYAITAHAPHPNQAYTFIDFELQPAHQVTDTVFIGYPTAVADLRSKLPKNLPETDVIFGGPGVDFHKLQEFVVHPATLALYENLYTEIKAAAA